MKEVLDTSVLIATGVPRLEGALAISVASIAELHFGVLITSDQAVRAERLRRLSELQRRFDALPIDKQEAVFGRTKDESVELDPLPDRSHVERVVIEEAGEELEIYRRSFPYGSTREAGLFFLAFSNEPNLVERMLARMFGIDGPSDRRGLGRRRRPERTDAVAEPRPVDGQVECGAPDAVTAGPRRILAEPR